MQATSVSTQAKDELYARQIAFCAAFILPMGKLLEAPSLLASFAKGDILLPAILQFLSQTLALLGILYAASRSEKSLWERIQQRLGKGVFVFYIFFALYYLFFAILPLLDFEKFVYAAFFDTAPTTFSFGFFFILLAFVCSKGLRSFARSADLCLFLFLLPFFALITMACFETDLTKLLPFFGSPFKGITQAVSHTAPHFSDALLLFPLIAKLKYKKGDGAKITIGYGAGAFMSLLFFAVFFGIFSSIAPREHYAFSKIAQYFSALDVLGRIDLVFIYLLSIVLLYYTCLPLLYTTECISAVFSLKTKALPASALSLFLFLFILFMNKYYNTFYQIISGSCAPIFLFISYLRPLFCLILSSKGESYAHQTKA